MKKITLILLLAAFIPVSALAGKSTYIVTNHRLNYVKLKELKRKVVETRGMTHPKEISEAQMRGILESIKLSRRALIGEKEKEDLSVFNEASINFLAPALVKAFREAGPDEEVVFSYLVKDPIFILRNDRISIANLWVHGDELHVKFQKLHAQVHGDIDKRGYSAKAVANARGLRLAFDLGPGQSLDIDDPEELVVDLTYDFTQKPQQTVAGTTSTAVSTDSTSSTGMAMNNNVEGSELTVEERLRKLEELKKEKLITNQEYREKKKEILEDL